MSALLWFAEVYVCWNGDWSVLPAYGILGFDHVYAALMLHVFLFCCMTRKCPCTVNRREQQRPVGQLQYMAYTVYTVYRGDMTWSCDKVCHFCQKVTSTIAAILRYSMMQVERSVHGAGGS